MADFVPRMPSEDEDFDAVLAPKRARKPRTPSQSRPAMAPMSPQPVVARSKPEPQTHSVAQPVKVSIAAEPEEVYEEPAYEEPEAVAEAPQQAAYAQEAYEPDPEPIVEEDEPHGVPEFVEPFSQEPDAVAPVEPAYVKPPKAPKPPKPARAPGGRRLSKHLVFEAILMLLVIGLGLWSWQLYTDSKALRSEVVTLEVNPQAAIQKQTDSLIQNVSRLITLPAGETPTIANVSDAAQARQQSAFFNNAQNGDKVLMYVKAGEAILYRPSTGKIILVAPLTFNSNKTP